MKVLKYFLAFCALLAVFFLGLLLFAPWETLGVLGLDMFRLDAAKRGVYVRYDRFEENGGLIPAYRMRALDVETPMARVSLSNVTVGIPSISGVLSPGNLCRIAFAGGGITLVPNNELVLEAGRVTLGRDREAGALRVSDVQFTGDLQVSGDMTYNLQTRKMIESSIVFTVPDQIGAMLNNPIMARFVESNEKGEWRIRYEAQNR